MRDREDTGPEPADAESGAAAAADDASDGDTALD